MTNIWILLLLALPADGTVVSEVGTKAYTLGESLSSVTITPVPIYVRHNERHRFPEIGLGFTDEFCSIEIPENAPAVELIKTLVVDNERVTNRTVLIKCCIKRGNNEGFFYINVTSDRNCEVRLRVGNFDNETTEAYQLKVELCTPSDFVNPQKPLTTLEIHAMDVNDNKPEFVFPSVRYKKPSPNVYYGAISRDSILGTQVLTVKAEDRDSGKFVAVSYEIVPGDKGSEYFAIGNATGVIRTVKLFSDVDKNFLPMAFKVLASTLSPCCSNTNEAKVVVNLIENDDRLIMVLEGIKRDDVQESKNEIEEMLQEHTGLIVGIEKFTPKQFLKDGKTLQSDDSATDVWFYAIDPETETILDINQRKVQRSILANSALSNITLGVFGNVQVNASTIHAPYVEIKSGTAVPADTFNTFILPCLVIVQMIAIIIFIYHLLKVFRRRNQRIHSGAEGVNNSFYPERTVMEHDPEISCSYLWIPMTIPLDDIGHNSVSSCSTRTTSLRTSGSSGYRTQEITTEL